MDEVAAAHLRTRPGDWSKLSPEGQSGLVVDPALRQQLAAASAAAVPSALTTGIQHVAGMQLGDLLGMTAGHMLGQPELFGGALGGLIGYGLPYLGGAVRGALRPSMLGAETVGAVGATAQPQARAP